MKMLRTLLTLLVITFLSMGLILLCPSKEEFAKYYVGQNQTGYGKLFDSAFEKVVYQKTTEKRYLIFVVFELDDQERYIGIAGNFVGKSSAEEAAKTLQELIDQGKTGL